MSVYIRYNYNIVLVKIKNMPYNLSYFTFSVQLYFKVITYFGEYSFLRYNILYQKSKKKINLLKMTHFESKMIKLLKVTHHHKRIAQHLSKNAQQFGQHWCLGYSLIHIIFTAQYLCTYQLTHKRVKYTWRANGQPVKTYDIDCWFCLKKLNYNS